MLCDYAQYLIFIYFNLQEIGEKQSMKRRRCTESIATLPPFGPIEG
jgi:hypothetical protein